MFKVKIHNTRHNPLVTNTSQRLKEKPQFNQRTRMGVDFPRRAEAAGRANFPVTNETKSD